MVIFFTEEDLVSFGEYMMSDQRRKLYEEHPEISSENIEERLKSVHNADLANWAQYTQQESFNE